jgi:hypothetical protein
MSRKSRLILAITGMIAVLISQLAFIFLNRTWSRPATLIGLALNAAIGIWAIWRPRQTL